MLDTNNKVINFDINDEMVVYKAEGITNFNISSFFDFFNNHLNAQLLKINDSQYSYDYLVDALHSINKSNIYFFQASEAGIFYQFEIVKNNDNTRSCFIRILSNVQNFETYGTVDYLTSVDSRGYFIKKVIKEMEEETHDPAVIMMLDIDNFKQINDRYGHNIGDNCLKQVSSELKRIINQGFVGRYGGDEFIIFLKNKSFAEIKDMINEILEIRYITSDKIENKINLGVSVGLRFFDLCQEVELFKIISEADKALYDSKRKGKNCYTVYGKEEDQKSIFVNKMSDKVKNTLFRDEIRKNNIFRYATFSVSFIILVICSIIIIQIFRAQFSNTIKKETNNTMTDISIQVNDTLQTKFDSWMKELSFISYSLDTTSQDKLDELLSIYENSVAFNHLALLLENGSLYFNQNTPIYNMSSDNLAKEIIIQKESYIGKTYIYNYGEEIIFGLPTTSIDQQVNGLRVNGIVGLCNIETFCTYLESSSFNHHTNVCLMNKDGEKIAMSNPDNTIFNSYYNINNVYKDYESKNEQIAFNTAMENGTLYTSEVMANQGIIYNIYGSTIEISINNKKLTEDWRLLVIVPNQVINMELQKMFNNIIIVYLVIFSTIGIFSMFLIYVNSKYRYRIAMSNYIDPLTKSINEKRFTKDVATTLQLYPDRKYALVYFNILKFKYINENYGFELGNEIILSLHSTINDCLCYDEMVCRVFGDRFICLMRNETDESLELRINKINDEMLQKSFNDCLIKLNLVCGIYKINHDVDINAAIDKATLALEYIDTGYPQMWYNYYKPEIMQATNNLNAIEQYQETALKNHEFVVYYQAKMDIHENQFVGSEALVRWNSPDKGLVSPGVFIPLFEKNGFIVKLDMYVFEQVCIDLRKQINQGIQPKQVSINLSGKHFWIDNFFVSYVDIINKYKIPTELLEFEITESIFVENQKLLLKLIDDIHSIGCKCSIDDFGTGYSSLNMIKNYNFDIIKLDKGFFYGVRGFDEKSKIIIKTLVELGHRLNKKVVAEGIEKEEQVEFLKEIQCDYIQGYYYAKPVVLEEYLKLVNSKESD